MLWATLTLACGPPQFYPMTLDSPAGLSLNEAYCVLDEGIIWIVD